ncbi:MAG: GAF domain-containing protein [Planctomycetes bacterium]|nr:GAF domain-containing protein [Planctomycetota bacterium]
MIQLILTSRLDNQQLTHMGGPLEIGRGPKRGDVDRVVVRDSYMSRDHIRLLETPEGRLQIENISQKATVLIDATTPIEPSSMIERNMPLRLLVGETIIDVDRSSVADDFNVQNLRTVAAPRRGREGELPNLLQLGSAPAAEEIVGWLEGVVSVQRAAAGSPEFYEQTARALVDKIGLDSGMVMLLTDGTWKVAAHITKNDNPTGRSFSQSILTRVASEKRTFYLPASALAQAESLRGVRGVVASPIFNASEQVVGVVYGTRMFSMSVREVGPIEASVVQLLASAVGAGLARLERESEAQRLRIAKEAAEEAERAKGQFLATVSHELRTPLTTIIGYSEMLIEQTEMDGTVQYIPDLKQIHGAGKHLLTLINDILDFSKIEAKKLELAKEAYDPLSLLRDLFSSMEPQAKKNKNRLEFDCSNDLGQGVGDATRIRQCVLNLLSNACKFTQEGVVTLSARRFNEAGTDYFRIAVTDSGIGMTPEQITRLFQPFTQVDSSAGRKYGGTGLGLAISQKLSGAMGGNIVVTSEAGKGSTFTMQIRATLV